MGPLEADGHRTLSIHSLRIQLPEHLEETLTVKKEKPIEKKVGEREKKVEKEVEKREKVEVEDKKAEDEDEWEEDEVVHASPRFTWSDEHVRSVKQERFGELLWPVMLCSYPFIQTDSCLFRTFATYKAFQQSDMSRHPERYPHNTLHDLMVLYMEGLLPVLQGKSISPKEADNLKRRTLLRQRFASRRLVWSPVYMEMYLVWSVCCKGMNRYQKIERFIQEFF